MERKLATVLFVDLVDSTALVTGADPEVVRRRVQRFFDRVSHCVTTHGGIVEKFAGDAVMAAFGIPQAHEDDAERAVRAGLAILDAVDELELQARVGVESGEVVADDGEATFATGEAVTLAARLEQAAEPGQLVLGPGAHRLTLGRVEVEDLGPVDLKGLAEPVWAWRALSTSGGGGARPRSMEAPLVGREAELDLLQNTYERALRDRRAHLFTIFGEPGVGKSRLGREFAGALEGATVDRKSTRLNSSHTLISYAVFCLNKKKNDFGLVSSDDSEHAQVAGLPGQLPHAAHFFFKEAGNHEVPLSFPPQGLPD